MDIEDLYGEVRRAVRGCPEDTMRDALLRAARTFCSETWLLRRPQMFTTVAGQQQYLVVAPPNEECFALKHAQIQDNTPGNSIYPLRFVYPTLINPNVGQARPRAICFVPYTTAALVPPPDNVYTVTLELITQPTINTMSLPDELGVKWDRALGYGALEWMLRMPSDPWFNPQAADEYQRLFNADIIKARIDAAFDFTPNQKNWIGGGFAWRR